MLDEGEPGESLRFFGPAAYEALAKWQSEYGVTVRWSPSPGVVKDGTRTKMATVSVREQGGPARKVILKLCPPGRRARREPGAHREALRAGPVAWVRAHMVEQPWGPVLLPDGGSLMFIGIAGGGMDRTKLLTALLDDPLAAAACGALVKSVLSDWNPDFGTDIMSPARMLHDRFAPRLAQGSSLHRVLEAAFPGLWETDAAWWQLPDGPAPNPLALSGGHPEFAELSLEVPLGRAQGDLHGDNVAYPRDVGETELGAFVLLDFDYFTAEGPLSHDPANLLLGVADHAWAESGPPVREALLRLLTDPEHDVRGALPRRLHETVTSVHRAGARWADRYGWADEWRQCVRLSTMACALVFAGRSAADPERLWWYVRLSAAAAGAFVAASTGVLPSAADAFTVLEPVTGPVTGPLKTPAPVAGRPVGADPGRRDPRPADPAAAHRAVAASRRVLDFARNSAPGDLVPRSVATAVHLRRIGDRIASGRTAPVPLLGEAGIGKSVMSAQIYEALAEQGDATALLVNCAHISETGDPLDPDRALGRLLDSGKGGGRLLSEVVADCAALWGRPVVLVLDTVDYLLNADTASPFLGLLRTLRDQGVVTVFTCRQHDYETWLEPRYGDLYVPRESVDVPALSREEVALMVAGYLRRQPGDRTGGFADAVLKAYDSRGMLAELLARPLLLTMLCELFSESVIPADLSATRLYGEYFKRKVVASRRYPPTTAESLAKQELVHELSRLLWNASPETLILHVAEATLWNGATAAAFTDLMSEAVLVKDVGYAGPKVGFRHQALTEYFLAMYLHERAPDDERALLAELRADPHGRWFAWPIVRRIVAMAEPAEMDALLDQLDLGDITAYRAVVFGAVEQYRPGLLTRLARRTRHADQSFTEQLITALPSVSDAGLGEAVRVAGELLTRIRAGLLPKLGLAAGRLTARGGPQAGPWLAGLLDLVHPRLRKSQSSSDAARVGHLVGNLLAPYVSRGLPLPPEAAHAAIALLRARETRRPAVRELTYGFLAPGTDAALRLTALRALLARGDDGDLSPAVQDLMLLVVPWGEGPAEGTGQRDLDDPLAFLTADAAGSSVIRLRAVARAAHENPELAARVTDAFLLAPTAGETQSLIRVLREVVRTGGADRVAGAFLDGELPTRPGGIGQVAGVLVAFSRSPKPLRLKLARWFTDGVDRLGPGAWSKQTLDARLRLVRDDPTLLAEALTVLGGLPDPDQERLIANLVGDGEDISASMIANLLAREGSPSGTPPFGAFVEARLYGAVAERNPEARERLAELANGPAKNAAAQAMSQLGRAAEREEDWAFAELLSPFAGHRDSAVRCAALRIVIRLVLLHPAEAGPVVELWLTEAAQRMSVPSGQSAQGPRRPRSRPEIGEEAVLRLALSHTYVRDGLGAEPGAVAAIAALVDLTLETAGLKTTSNSVLRQLVVLLKALSASRDHPLHARVFNWLSELLRRTDLYRVQDAPAFARETLGRCLESGTVDFEQIATARLDWRPRNWLVVVQLVRTHDPLGPRSPLLDVLLASPACPPPVTKAIAVYRNPAR
ncbi:hypothetical protein ACFO3J_30955 [Streptomyces polygonati]|uniref:AAA+ ATPase domain-containing protein n=1 Tax=Streptomyces polygonati TaxID=1617087 RepID=A0ABV8HVX2_9ACTN